MSQAWPIHARSADLCAPVADSCESGVPDDLRFVIGDTLGPLIGVIDDPAGNDLTGWSIEGFLRNAAGVDTPATVAFANPVQRIVSFSVAPSVTAALAAGVYEVIVRVFDSLNRYTLHCGFVELVK